MEDCENGNSKK